MFKLVTTGLFTGTEYVDHTRDSAFANTLYDAHVKVMNTEDRFSSVALYMWVEGVGTWHLVNSATPEWAKGFTGTLTV